MFIMYNGTRFDTNKLTIGLTYSDIYITKVDLSGVLAGIYQYAYTYIHMYILSLFTYLLIIVVLYRRLHICIFTYLLTKVANCNFIISF